MSLPDIPDLPQQPAPTLAERLQHAALLMHRADLEMRERHEQASQARHDAWLQQSQAVEQAADRRDAAATQRSQRQTEAANRQAAAAEHTNEHGIPTDQPMVDAINGLRAALEAWQPVPGDPTQPGAPAWAGDVRQALQTAAQALLAAAQAIPSE